MRVSSWQRGLQGVTGVLALGLVVGFSPNAARAICGDGVPDGGQACVGDCDNSGSVTVDEIVTMVNIALGGAPVTACPNGDGSMDGSITVDEIITAVNNALNGCPAAGAGTATEDCDNGGNCIGGANAGTACTAEGDCMGDGACFGGPDNLRGCTSDGDCSGGTCRKCRPYGGDGCAANCTDETDALFQLVPGMTGADGMSIVFGTSGAVVFGTFLTVALELNGSQILTLGAEVNGEVPVVLKASGISLDAIPIQSIACACVRGAESRTCGGTLFDTAGIQSANCTPGFGTVEPCPADKACAPVHGAGNTGSGFIGCGSAGVDIDFTQDCKGTPGEEPDSPVVTVTASTDPAPPASAGNAFVVITSAIGTVVGRCTGTTSEYGPDGVFCTDDDSVANRGTPNSIPFTTKDAQGTVLNGGDFEGENQGPYGTVGNPFTCNGAGTYPGVSGSNLAGAFTSCDQPTVSDIVVPVNFAAE